MISSIEKALRNRGVTANSEAEFSITVRSLLDAAGIEYEIEVELSNSDRIDLMCGDVGLELKVGGSSAEVLRQLDRYLAHEQVASIVLVTTSRRLASCIPPELRGKPVRSVVMGAM